MNQEIKQKIHATMEHYIEVFNTRDADRWAKIMHYPHLRVTAFKESGVFHTEEEFAAGVNYNRLIDLGWHHSVWNAEELIHVSEDKIHATGQYSRHDKNGEKLHINKTTYILTRVGNQWGVQGRFNTGLYLHPLSDNEDTGQKAKEVLGAYYAACAEGDREKISELLHFPCFDMYDNQVDQLKTVGNADPLRSSEIKGWQIKPSSIDVVQKSGAAVNVGVAYSSGNGAEGKTVMAYDLFLIILKNDRWSIMARSSI